MTTSLRSLIVSLSLLSVAKAFVAPGFSRAGEAPPASALSMVVRNKGLEVRRDGATPTGESVNNHGKLVWSGQLKNYGSSARAS